MKAHLTIFAALTLALPALAMRHIGFETDAFNRMFPVSYAKNVVFSPAAFEIDCAIIAESLDTIAKAKVSEQLGVVIDFQSSYRPVIEAFEARTNGNLVISARGFCVPDIGKANKAHRRYLERVYNTEVMRFWPKDGAEAWFRTTMEGEMENFALPVDVISERRFAFYDLVSADVAWLEPFPTANTRKLNFIGADGTREQLDFMADVRAVEAWENNEFTMLKLPLNGSAWFFALMPRDSADFAVVRKALSSDRIDQLLTITKSVTEPGVFNGAAAVVLPRLQISSRLNMTSAFSYFKIPINGLAPIAGAATSREMVQFTKFNLGEHGRSMPALEKKAEGEEVRMGADTRRFVFNRPFLFFVYHEPTATILVAGQFTGKE